LSADSDYDGWDDAAEYLAHYSPTDPYECPDCATREYGEDDVVGGDDDDDDLPAPDDDPAPDDVTTPDDVVPDGGSDDVVDDDDDDVVNDDGDAADVTDGDHNSFGDGVSATVNIINPTFSCSSSPHAAGSAGEGVVLLLLFGAAPFWRMVRLLRRRVIRR